MSKDEPKQFKNIIIAVFRYVIIASFGIIIKITKHSLLLKSKMFLKNNPDALNMARLVIAKLIYDIEELKTKVKEIFEFVENDDFMDKIAEDEE